MHCIASSQILRQNNLGHVLSQSTEIQIHKSGQIEIFRTLLNRIQNKGKKAGTKREKKRKSRHKQTSWFGSGRKILLINTNGATKFYIRNIENQLRLKSFHTKNNII